MKAEVPSDEEVRRIGCYGDPSLKGERLVELGLMLLRSRMAAPRKRRSAFGLRPFTLHKREHCQRQYLRWRGS